MPNRSTDNYDALVLAQFPGRLALTLREFAAAIGSTEKSVRTRLSQGKLNIRTLKIGRSRRIPVSEVAKFLKAMSSASD